MPTPVVPRIVHGILAALAVAAVTLSNPVDSQGGSMMESHPPARPCETWVGSSGSSAGNLGFTVRAELCTRGSSLSGTIEFVNPDFGFTVREIAGKWQAGHSRMEFHETRTIREKLTPAAQATGGRFCHSDEIIRLTRASETRIEGTYDAPGCDAGVIELTLERSP